MNHAIKVSIFLGFALVCTKISFASSGAHSHAESQPKATIEQTQKQSLSSPQVEFDQKLGAFIGTSAIPTTSEKPSVAQYLELYERFSKQTPRAKSALETRQKKIFRHYGYP